MKRPITAAAILVTTLACAAPAALPRATADLAKDGVTPGVVGNGKIAWVSDRTGNDIFTMNADGSGQTNLSNDPSFDDEPAWSPDGTKVAYTRYANALPEIFVMNADGSGETNLTNNAAPDVEPSWAPSGTKIAFARRIGNNNWEILAMNADGSGQTNLTNNGADDEGPAWSPDGGKIAFMRRINNHEEIYVMNADGSGQSSLYNGAGLSYLPPAWSPDGTKIAFSRLIGGSNIEIFVMNADGSGLTNLTNDPASDELPDWSPDGTKIVFRRLPFGSDREIFVMNADGSGQTNLTNNPADDESPDWQPSPTITCTGGQVTVLDAGPASPYPSTCSIPATPESIADVNVQLNRLSHTYPDDIDLLLVAPNGDNAIFMSDAGTLVDVLNCTLKIDDEAATKLPDTNGITCPGNYKPANHGAGDPFPAPAPAPSGAVNLSTFDGGTPSGTWSLYVVDDQAQDTGHIARWRLTITLAQP